MFLSVNHAIDTAYYSQIKTPYKAPAMNTICGATASSEPVTWEDIATQAGMVFQILREQLSEDDRLLLDAWKITPEGKALEDRKIKAIEAIAINIAHKVKIDKRYIFVVVAHYCGLQQGNSEDWWADKLGKNIMTLRRARNGRCNKPGINGLLDNRVNSIFSRLGWRFRELGWLPE